MYIRNCWYVASWAHELSAEQPMAMTIMDEPLVLFRDAAGTARALKDCCCHRNAPLSHGRCENGRLRCMYHGLVFDGTGACVLIPGQRHVPAAFRVQSYPVVEASGLIWVWMGEAAAADPSLIEGLDAFDTAAWDMRTGWVDIQANYLLLNDNLSDMSHVAFVHEATFGGGDLRIANSYPKVTLLERGIRAERWLADRGVLEEWLPENAGVPEPQTRRLDQWLVYDLLVPGFLVMRVEIYPAGAAQESGFLAPKRNPVHANLGVQAITPMSTGSTRYFFSLGPRRTETADNPRLADEMFEVMLKAFAEDKRILEAQQRNVARWPLNQTTAIKHDLGLHMMRRKIADMIAREAAPGAAPAKPLARPVPAEDAHFSRSTSSRNTASSPLE
jgi:vanillate O-demethylase monooxygenase subunit